MLHPVRSAVVPALLQLHLSRETCPGSGSDPCVRWHLPRNVLYEQQVSCQAPPSRSSSRNGVGLVFPCLLGSWFLRGPVVPEGSRQPGKRLQQRQGLTAALTHRSGHLRGDGDKPEGAEGCREWGQKGKRQQLDWDPGKSTVWGSRQCSAWGLWS